MKYYFKRNKKISNQKGAAMVEYATLVSNVALIALLAVLLFGQAVADKICGVAYSVREEQSKIIDSFYDRSLGKCCFEEGFGSVCD